MSIMNPFVYFDRVQSTLKLSIIHSGAVIDVKYCNRSDLSETALVSMDDGTVYLLRNAGVHSHSSVTGYDCTGHHNNIVFSVEWLNNHCFLTASADKTICEWEISSTSSFIKKSMFVRHSSAVKTVSVCPSNDNLFVSGGRDGNLFLWDKRCHSSLQNSSKVYNKPCLSLTKAHENVEALCPTIKKMKTLNALSVDSLNGITAVKWLNSSSGHTLISTAAAHNCVLMWDIRHCGGRPNKMHCVRQYNYPGHSLKRVGYSSLCVGPYEDCFYASCTDNNIYRFSISSPSSSTTVLNNPAGCSYFTRIESHPTEEFVISGSCENRAFIWHPSQSTPLAELNTPHHQAEVSCVSWNKTHPTHILTGCEGGKVALWAKDFLLKSHCHPAEPEPVGHAELTPDLSPGHRRFPNIIKSIERRRRGLSITASTKTRSKSISEDAATGDRCKEKVCSGLVDLPDFVRQTPRKVNDENRCPSTPTTCPARLSGTTPSPRKQFMANFRSAFKCGKTSKLDTPLKTNLTLANSNRVLSPIAESGQKSSSKKMPRGGQRVKRKLDHKF